MVLAEYDYKRYDRQLLMKSVGLEGQAKLKDARVFVAGAGGIGSPALAYLASAGVGTLRFADDGYVELSNLNRQILHYENNLEESKIDSALEKLRQMNSTINYEPIAETITDENAAELARGCNCIVDALDNLLAKQALNLASLQLRIPLMHASVEGMEARIATFIPGQTACLRCLYPSLSACTKFPVLGAAPAFAASVQVMEVVKFLTGKGKLLAGKMLRFNAENAEVEIIEIARDPLCSACFGARA